MDPGYVSACMPRWIKALLTKSQQMRPRQHDGAGCSSRACLPQCHLHGRKQGNAQLNSNDIAHGYPISRQLARLSRQGLKGNRLNCDNCPSNCSVRQPETLLSSEKQSQGTQRIILQEIHRVTKIRPASSAWGQRHGNKVHKSLCKLKNRQKIDIAVLQQKSHRFWLLRCKGTTVLDTGWLKTSHRHSKLNANINWPHGHGVRWSLKASSQGLLI